jgi:outer membrane biosynthesis protein TonB
MRKSQIASLLCHAALLVAALVVLPNPAEFVVKPQDAIQVDISMIGDVSKRQAQSKAADKVIEAPKPKPAEVVKPAEPAPEVAPEIKTASHEPVKPPEPKPPEPNKVEPPKPEPAKVEEPKPVDDKALNDLLKKVDEPKPVKPVEKPKVVEKKPEKKPAKPNFDEISAFLNKTDDKKTAPPKPTQTAGEPAKGSQDIQGTDDALSATIVDALVSKVKGCFNVPPAARDANISIRISFQLNPDGSVAGEPQIQNPSSDPIYDATARAAVSAILECQNYELPPDRYDLWKDNTLDFNPNLMFGT